MRARKIVLLSGFLALALSQLALAGGLHIHPRFVGGTPPPADLVSGRGTIEEIFRVAADNWEAIYPSGDGDWDVTIEYEWANAGNFGRATPGPAAGQPPRIASGHVIFRNQRSTGTEDAFPGWYLDPTPRQNEEFERYTCYGANVPGGWLNVGRVFSEAKGDARGRLDLLTIATHEIGHLLGLDTRYDGYEKQLRQRLYLDVTAPRPLAGLPLLVSQGTADHLADRFGLERDTALMVPDPFVGERQLISGLDALAIAQASSFPSVDVRQNCPSP